MTNLCRSSEYALYSNRSDFSVARVIVDSGTGSGPIALDHRNGCNGVTLQNAKHFNSNDYVWVSDFYPNSDSCWTSPFQLSAKCSKRRCINSPHYRLSLSLRLASFQPQICSYLFRFIASNTSCCSPRTAWRSKRSGWTDDGMLMLLREHLLFILNEGSFRFSEAPANHFGWNISL